MILAFSLFAGVLALAAVPVFAQHNGSSRDNNVAVCHKGHTIHVGAPAVAAHVRHGDTAGACGQGTPTATSPSEGTPTETPEATPTATLEATPTDTVEPTATGTAEATATDTPEATATDTPEPTIASASQGSIGVVCHHGHTLHTDPQGAAAHVRHGDTAGPC
jgi:hypothetical protein